METLLQTLGFHELLTIMASALGCGLLIGLERQRKNNAGGEQSFAGLRSFTVCALLGSLCFLIHLTVGLVGAITVSLFSYYGLIKQQKDIGATTELAFVMTYFIGAACVYNIALAASLAVVLTIILMTKTVLHNFAGSWIKEYELRDGLFLLALILIALPMMPNEALWGAVLNPYVIFKLLILILVVQSLAHIAKRLLSANKAIILSAIASGFVSSTATIASLGMEVRAGKASAKSNAGAGLFSCVATLVQLLIIVLGVSFAWFKLLLLPSIMGMVILSIVAFYLIYSSTKQSQVNKYSHHQAAQNLNDDASNGVIENPPQDTRMFSLKEAAIIAVTLTAIQVMVYGFTVLLGDKGLVLGTLLASLFEIHAAIATVVMQGDIQNITLVYAIIIGLFAHALSKSINAFLTGGWKYFLYFAPTQIFHMLCVIAVLMLTLK